MATRAKAENVSLIGIAGDLTDKKDNHDSRLVNRIIDQIGILSEIAPVYLIKGNHDYTDPEQPFFRFIQGIPRVQYYTWPTEKEIEGKNFLFLPHTQSFLNDWQHLKFVFARADYIIFHQAIDGAVTPTGFKVDGISRRTFRNFGASKKCIIFGGDIHVPQKIGPSIYIGAPYPVDFGDNYEPRVLLEEGGRVKFITRKTLKKASIKIRKPREILKYVEEGDMVRVTLEMTRSDFVNWEEKKNKVVKLCKKHGITLKSVELSELPEKDVIDEKELELVSSTPQQIVEDFVKQDASGTDAVLQMGLTLIAAADEEK